MKITFSKYHGSGNDFIMIDERKNGSFLTSKQNVSALCDRHFGIGADGLIVLRSSKDVDFHMDFYNADGKPGSMCGNGGRCSVAFAKEIGLIDDTCSFTAPDGLHHGSINPEEIITIDLKNVSGVEKMGNDIFMNTGSPHFIRFVDSAEDIDVDSEGKKIRHDARFIGGTNANFVEFTEKGIKVRTFERGVEAETLSCGTGVTASAIAAFIKKPALGKDIPIETLGGKLRVKFEQNAPDSFINLLLSGPAVKVFEGESASR